jgi:hypothetical protein
MSTFTVHLLYISTFSNALVHLVNDSMTVSARESFFNFFFWGGGGKAKKTENKKGEKSVWTFLRPVAFAALSRALDIKGQ